MDGQRTGARTIDREGGAVQTFEYVSPASLEEAVTLLAAKDGKARPLAGGTDLLVQLRAERYALERVVDVKAIPELNELRFSLADGLTLGAAVPCYRIYEHPGIAAAYPALADSVSIIGGIGIQGRASVGGNLCNASPSGDTIPSLIVLGATCNLVGPQGRRSVSVEQFCIAPGTTILEPGELLVSLHLPPPEPRAGSHYLRFIPRNEMDIAVAGAAAWLTLG
ncbi:MAG: FAD binding domain-containing protein, partial [Chloroflexota bacterium]